MSARRTLALCLVAGVAAIVGVSVAAAKAKPSPSPKPSPPPAKTEASVVRVHDGWRCDLTFDGRLADWVVRRTAPGRRELDVLVANRRDDEGAAKCGVIDEGRSELHDARLYRWRAAQPDRLELLVGDLSSNDVLDVADLDGDGIDDLLLLRDGGIQRLVAAPGGGFSFQPMVADPTLEIGRGGVALAHGSAEIDPALRVAQLGSLRSYKAAAEGRAVLGSDLALPTHASPSALRYLVESPRVSMVGRGESGRVTFATEPEAYGKQRLRTLLLDPDAPAEPRSTESWANLPAPEHVLDRAFAILDGKPVLIVTTTSAEKLSLLGEKGLRIFPLGGDRTRAGDAPLYATTTGLNLWQEATISVLDLDKDGRDDLVLAYWKGLKNAIAAIEVHRGLPEGGFAKPHTTSFDVTDGKRGYLGFGRDLDGDGRPDLALLAGHELLVYPGSAADRSMKATVADSPSRRIALPDDFRFTATASVSLGPGGFEVSSMSSAWGTPALLDLDGDGRPDALFADEAAGGARLVLAFVRGAE